MLFEKMKLSVFAVVAQNHRNPISNIQHPTYHIAPVESIGNRVFVTNLQGDFP